MSERYKICPECNAYMKERDGWFRCDCGYAVKVQRKVIKPVGGSMALGGVGDVDDFNAC